MHVHIYTVLENTYHVDEKFLLQIKVHSELQYLHNFILFTFFQLSKKKEGKTRLKGLRLHTHRRKQQSQPAGHTTPSLISSAQDSNSQRRHTGDGRGRIPRARALNQGKEASRSGESDQESKLRIKTVHLTSSKLFPGAPAFLFVMKHETIIYFTSTAGLVKEV